jgi:hypothetical protein
MWVGQTMFPFSGCIDAVRQRRRGRRQTLLLTADGFRLLLQKDGFRLLLQKDGFRLCPSCLYRSTNLTYPSTNRTQ